MTLSKPSFRFLFCRKALCITIFGISVIQAAPVPFPHSIDTLVILTLARNPEIKLYEAEIAVAKAGRSKAGKLANPQLDLDLGHKRASGGDAQTEGFPHSLPLSRPP